MPEASRGVRGLNFAGKYSYTSRENVMMHFFAYHALRTPTGTSRLIFSSDVLDTSRVAKIKTILPGVLGTLDALPGRAVFFF